MATSRLLPFLAALMPPHAPITRPEIPKIKKRLTSSYMMDVIRSEVVRVPGFGVTGWAFVGGSGNG